MDWTIEHHEESGVVKVTTRGRFNAPDHAQMTEDILSRPFWRPGATALFDHRELDMSGVSFDVMLEASATHVKHDDRIGNGKAAIVVGSVVDLGSARQFEELAAGEIAASLKVFRDVDEAWAWVTS